MAPKRQKAKAAVAGLAKATGEALSSAGQRALDAGGEVWKKAGAGAGGATRAVAIAAASLLRMAGLASNERPDKAIFFRVREIDHLALQALAASQGRKMDDLLREALAELFIKYVKKLPPPGASPEIQNPDQGRD